MTSMNRYIVSIMCVPLMAVSLVRAQEGTFDNLTLKNAINFGTTRRQILNLWANEYGIGIQDWTLYQRSSGGFEWYNGGIHSNDQADPGKNGKPLMDLDRNGNLSVHGAVGSSIKTNGAQKGFAMSGSDYFLSDNTLRQMEEPLSLQKVAGRKALDFMLREAAMPAFFKAM